MDRIPLVDLEAHHAPLVAELRAATERVLRSGRFVLGDEVAAFESELAAELGFPGAVGVSSGTDALLATLMAAGVGPGHEVITTPFSFFASVEAILRLGARPVFADVEPDTLNLDPEAALARLGPRTRAVLVVHLFGRRARLDPLLPACAGAGVPIIEDAAQAIGAVGLGLGWAVTLSFFPSKNLGGFGDGGAVLTRDPALLARLRRLRNHGVSGKLCHEEVGGNFRLDELQAALLRVKLPRLQAWTAARRRLAQVYRDRLSGTACRLPPPDPGAVWNQFVIRVGAEVRDRLRQHLAERGVATAVYYPLPLHLQPAMARFGLPAGSFPEAERAAREVVALPIFPELSEAAAARVATALANFSS